jgi:uncharacterized membrane protein SpoIIM required for sporulation
MELSDFVDARRTQWNALETLLKRAETVGLAKLTLSEAQSLSKLYRKASSDLLWVRARSGSVEVCSYLNDLVGRAYALTYPGRRFHWREVLSFITTVFPGTVRQEWRVIAASFLLFISGGTFGALGVAFDPQAAPYLVPADHLSLDPTKRALDEQKNEGASVGEQAAFSSFLFTHNIQVAFLAFALGLTAGVGTTVLLFGNGLLLGALAAVYSHKSLSGWFWAWILPHGIPEITAICLAGAGGLVLARALIAPKGLARRLALRRESITALTLLLGTLLLFVFAGLIEGTISQIHPPRLSIAFKLTFALCVGLGTYAYLGSAWLKARRLKNAPSFDVEVRIDSRQRQSL